MQFQGDKPDGQTYPVAYYRGFLEYIANSYRENCWEALPKEVAQFTTNSLSQPRPPKRVCMVSFSYYEMDNRVMRYAEALAARGDSVDILALRRSKDLSNEETIRGVRVIRIQDRFDKSTKGKSQNSTQPNSARRRVASRLRLSSGSSVPRHVSPTTRSSPIIFGATAIPSELGPKTVVVLSSTMWILLSSFQPNQSVMMVS